MVGVVSLVGAADQTTEAYAAREPIAVGETLTTDKLHRVKVRLGEVEQHYLTPESGLDAGLVAVQRIGKDQLLPRESFGQLDGLDRKPVAVTVEETLPAQAVAGSRVDVWVALPDTRNGFSAAHPAAAPAPKLPRSPRAAQPWAPPGPPSSWCSSPTRRCPSLLGAQANKAKISVVWNPGGTCDEHSRGDCGGLAR